MQRDKHSRRCLGEFLCQCYLSVELKRTLKFRSLSASGKARDSTRSWCILSSRGRTECSSPLRIGRLFVGFRYFILEDGSWMIREASTLDSGVDVWNATNKFGFDTRSGTLNVKWKTHIQTRPGRVRVRVCSTVSLLTLTPSARQTDVGDHQIDASRQDVLLGNGVRSHYSSSQKVSSRRATPSSRRRWSWHTRTVRLRFWSSMERCGRWTCTSTHHFSRWLFVD